MKEARFIEGLKALKDGKVEYEYQYNEKMIYNCHIEKWRRQVFEARYPQITQQILVDEFAQFLSLPGEMLGKRSGGVFLSSNRKFCFKIIDEETFRKHEQIFDELQEFQEDKQSDFLLDIYGLYIVHSSQKKFKYKDLIILMPCLRGKVQGIMNVYDLKGYTQGSRNMSQQEYEDFKFGKDINFASSKQLQIIQSIEPERKQAFIQNFIKNAQFLLKHNIIDYSLLISFEIAKPNQGSSDYLKSLVTPNGILIKWAIIDYFQEYNKKKKAETMFKGLFYKDVSSVDPETYFHRFVEFLKKYFS